MCDYTMEKRQKAGGPESAKFPRMPPDFDVGVFLATCGMFFGSGPGMSFPPGTSTVGQRLRELSACNLAFFFTKGLCRTWLLAVGCWLLADGCWLLHCVGGRREYVANYFNCFASAQNASNLMDSRKVGWVREPRRLN